MTVTEIESDQNLIFDAVRVYPPGVTLVNVQSPLLSVVVVDAITVPVEFKVRLTVNARDSCLNIERLNIITVFAC